MDLHADSSSIEGFLFPQSAPQAVLCDQSASFTPQIEAVLWAPDEMAGSRSFRRGRSQLGRLFFFRAEAIGLDVPERKPPPKARIRRPTNNLEKQTLYRASDRSVRQAAHRTLRSHEIHRGFPPRYQRPVFILSPGPKSPKFGRNHRQSPWLPEIRCSLPLNEVKLVPYSGFSGDSK